MSNELLPCPFCGGEPEMYEVGNRHTKSWKMVIKCKGCFIYRENKVIRQTPEWLHGKMVEHWNKRTPDYLSNRIYSLQNKDNKTPEDFEELEKLNQEFLTREGSPFAMKL